MKIDAISQVLYTKLNNGQVNSYFNSLFLPVLVRNNYKRIKQTRPCNDGGHVQMKSKTGVEMRAIDTYYILLRKQKHVQTIRT